MSAGPIIICPKCGKEHFGPRHEGCPAAAYTLPSGYDAVESSTCGLRLYTPRHDVPPRLQQAWMIKRADSIRIEWRDVPLVIATGEHAGV